MRDDSPHLKGNERYSGFIVDLLEKLSRLLKFQYYIKEVEDNKYGVYNESTGSYNGLIGEILLGVSLDVNLCKTSLQEFSPDFASRPDSFAQPRLLSNRRKLTSPWPRSRSTKNDSLPSTSVFLFWKRE